jgi:DnaJ family protein C protein 13
MAAAAAEEVAHLAAAARAQQATATASGGSSTGGSTASLEWQLPEGFRLQYQELAGELAVGGVYVRLFLKDPRYPLRYCRVESVLQR